MLRRLRIENLRTTTENIVRRDGLDPWKKLFQNLRASRQTELSATMPMHVVCAWIGNTEDVAFDHYLKPTGAHFEQMTEVKGGGKDGSLIPGAPEQADAKNAAKITAEGSGKDRKDKATKRENPR